ncbi:hypothetical protein KKA47_07035 [bacterium]|nr:hypothetical protein [bacterium]
MSVKEIASYVYTHLKSKGLDCVLSGGACVTIYSDNEYESKDLDFVMADYLRKDIDNAMKEINFSRVKNWRHYENPKCPYLVEFPPTPLAVGEEHVSKTNIIKTKYGILKILRPVDCVKDRLAAFYHWGDRQALEQAIMVASKNKVSIKEVKKWSINEGSLDKFEIFHNLLGSVKSCHEKTKQDEHTCPPCKPARRGRRG